MSINIVSPAVESLEQKLARLECENLKLKADAASKTTQKLKLKITEKGGLSVYGLGRFPITLYKSQWVKLLSVAAEIQAFLETNSDLLADKSDKAVAVDPAKVA